MFLTGRYAATAATITRPPSAKNARHFDLPLMRGVERVAQRRFKMPIRLGVYCGHSARTEMGPQLRVVL
jgi:hypothetical protein